MRIRRTILIILLGIGWQTNASFQQDRYDYAKNYHSSDLLMKNMVLMVVSTLHPGILEYR